MPTCSITRRALTGLLATAPFAARAQSSATDRTASLDLVASFDAQVTGVAVAPSGRIFVNFPRWEQDVAVSVAEIGKDGTLRPYPDAEWNRWTDAAPLSNPNHFICVQSVTVDPNSPATFTVAVTGIAGPDGGTPAKPVGTVWIATGARGADAEATLLEATGDRRQVRERSVVRALELLSARIEATPARSR